MSFLKDSWKERNVVGRKKGGLGSNPPRRVEIRGGDREQRDGKDCNEAERGDFRHFAKIR